MFSIENGLKTREIIQYLFTLQYFVLILNIRIPWDKFEILIYRFTVLLALIIISLHTYFYFTSPSVLYDEMWAVKYIPAWPNGVPIPLLMGLWLSFYKQKHFMIKLLIILALFFTTSRLAILGGLIIVGYYLLRKSKYNKSWIIVLVYCLPIVCGYIILNPALMTILTFFGDRVNIFWTTMEFLFKETRIRFWRNTIDQLMGIYGSKVALTNWFQTHNLGF